MTSSIALCSLSENSGVALCSLKHFQKTLLLHILFVCLLHELLLVFFCSDTVVKSSCQ